MGPQIEEPLRSLTWATLIERWERLLGKRKAK